MIVALQLDSKEKQIEKDIVELDAQRVRKRNKNCLLFQNGLRRKENIKFFFSSWYVIQRIVCFF